MPDTNAKTLKLTVAVDTDEVRQWAEKFVDAGKHGLAVVLYAFLDHPERFAIDEAVTDPAPTPPSPLAEALREHAKWERCINAPNHADALLALADRVEAVEKERDAHVRDYRVVRNQRDAARVEVEQMSRQVADQMTAIHTANAEVERLTSGRTSKESLPVALPDPADVPKDEIWLVEVDNQTIVGKRDTGDPEVPWALFVGVWVPDSHITLISRLVPDVRRVIDRPEDLDALPVGSVVRGKTGRPWRSDGHGHWDCGVAVHNAGYVLHFYGPVTVIYEGVTA